MLAQDGIDASYKTVRRWSSKFGLAYARKLRRSHPRADTRWHLDEVFASINGKNVYLWRAVDCEGEVLDVLVQSRRNKRAALKLMRKVLKSQGFSPDAVMTDELPSYGAALSELGMRARHITGGRNNNRAENSHWPIRHIQHLQRPAPSHLTSNTTAVSCCGDGEMARGDSGGLNLGSRRSSATDTS